MEKRIIRIVLEALSLAILLGTVVFLILYWKRIPAQVPVHYDMKGQIDGWGEKAKILLHPALMAVLYVLLSFSKTLRLRSMGRETRVPAPELLFPVVKLVLLTGFSYMVACAALSRPIGAWCMPVFLAAVSLPLIVGSVSVLRAKS